MAFKTEEENLRWKNLFHGASEELLKRFLEYHKANPKIYEVFSKYSDQAWNSGKRKFSHWMIINRIRWYAEVEVNTEEEFKISNDFIAFYGRLYIFHHPERHDFFDFKALNPDRGVLERKRRLGKPAEEDDE